MMPLYKFTTDVKRAIDDAVEMTKALSGHKSVRDTILDHLRKLKEATPPSEEVIVAFRKYLREEIIQKETKDTSTLCGLAFHLQLLLARYWPTNDQDDEDGCYIDSVLGERIPLDGSIPSDSIIPVSSGQIYLRASLELYFLNTATYSFDTGDRNNVEKIRVKGLYNSPPSEREIDYLRQNGIIPRSEALLNCLHYVHDNELGSIKMNPSGGIVSDSKVADAWFGLLHSNYRPIRWFAIAAEEGGRSGREMVGEMYIYASVLMIMDGLFPLAFVVAMVNGLVYLKVYRKPQESSLSAFANGFFHALRAVPWLSILLLIMGASVIAGLAGISAISLATTKAAAVIMGQIVPFLPLAIGGLGILIDCFKPIGDMGLIRAIDLVLERALQVILMAGWGLVGGAVGFTFGVLVSTLEASIMASFALVCGGVSVIACLFGAIASIPSLLFGRNKAANDEAEQHAIPALSSTASTFRGFTNERSDGGVTPPSARSSIANDLANDKLDEQSYKPGQLYQTEVPSVANYRP